MKDFFKTLITIIAISRRFWLDFISEKKRKKLKSRNFNRIEFHRPTFRESGGHGFPLFFFPRGPYNKFVP